MTLRPLILPVALAAVMGCVAFLPKAGKVAQSAILMKLPEDLGEWEFHIIPASQKEVDILAKDTDFSKAVCLAPIPGVYGPDGMRLKQRVDLSVVLSGSDINNSIHRPERCMPAQGHRIYDAKSESITTPGGKTFPVRELTSMQTIPLDPKGEKTATFHCITYYFFVGQHQITENHMWRTALDMGDRIFRGQDQRWAYVSASMWFSENGENGFRTREQAEKEARLFLGNLADTNIDWNRIAER
ncbi:exosortase-associated EpsI family protein [Luteolibacter sp. LG18]|uniref:exosortase-associated EpsI family protein n=1 Tax=Luteolibacter sp. LG18 TaxID=2819286 RepID=UPI002B2F3DB9|nr:hypothetical protein llg_16480 [Luteolibacter sp. LG18]